MKTFKHRILRRFLPYYKRIKGIFVAKLLPNENNINSDKLNLKYVDDDLVENHQRLCKLHIDNFIMDLKETIGESRKIVLGPWIGELGYELLYWIPFLRFLKSKGVFDNKECIVISRGGMQYWYSDICTEYIEIFDQITLEEYTLLRKRFYSEQVSNKNIYTSATEILIAKKCRADYEFLFSQSIMFSFLNQFIKSLGKRATLNFFTSVLQLEIPEDFPKTNNFQFPENEKYIITNFYSRPSFQITLADISKINAMLFDLSKEFRIIRIDEFTYDLEHNELSNIYDGIPYQGIESIGISSNLLVKTALIRNADFYIGTYGGPSYLSVLNGIPTFVFSSSYEGLNPMHENLIREIVRKTKKSWVHMTVADLSLFPICR